MGSLALFLQLQGDEAALEEATGQIDVSDVRLFVESCLEGTYAQGERHIGEHGGYYVPDSDSEEVSFVPYYWRDAENLMPSVSEVENQLGLYVEGELDSCLDGFSGFAKMGAQISAGSSSAQVTLQEDGAVTRLEYSVTVASGDDQAVLREFRASVDSRLRERLGVIESIMEEQERVPDAVPVTFIGQRANEHDFELYRWSVTSDDVLFVYSFAEEEASPFVFSYLAGYPWSERRLGS